ncbi:MAG: phosphate ABC transporter substrate-binding protein PstS, partial [Proteobacteria bacterium]|nr:phosphate ABC transporter substrate-binding protein PstS [Pseudomonadota bacterium]
TFPYPLYSKWFSDYSLVAPDTQINYQSIGSGGGIRQFTDRTVDFGATDSPMTDEQLKKLGEPVLHIPTAIGSVVLSFNLPGERDLKLTPELISAIFMGEVKKWDDPRIIKINPGLKAKTDIVVVHRSDGSGTTGVFTDYLSKVSPAWKERVGAGTSVNWPAGLGGKGNEGVAGLIKQTPASIGYVEFIYAKTNQLAVAQIKNSQGEFVEPSLKALTNAALAELSKMPTDFRTSITNASGKGSYPISSYTYLLIRQTMSVDAKGPALVRFLKWAMHEGQTKASALEYAPLPPALVKKIETAIDSITIGK